jgi:hypothetical protein
MATMIKKAQQPSKPKRQFKAGETVEWMTSFHDGRSYERTRHTGTIIRVNPVTVTVKDTYDNIWRVKHNEVR